MKWNRISLFSLVVLIIVVFVSGAASAQDASHIRLNKLGVLIGTGDGITDEYLDKPATKIDAAILVLKLKGLIDEAENYSSELNFDDASEALSDYSRKIMGYLRANPQLGFIGYKDRFDPNSPLTDMMLYKVLLTLLDYEQGREFEWSETIMAAKYFADMNAIAGMGELTTRDTAQAIIEALGAEIKNSGILLIQKLVHDEAISAQSAIDAGWIFIQ